ncbi:alpha/beta fold hydrolase [Salipaludibacillus sp. CF4.18]|uniref:alpha/beta fold hydrolase n=1 Tax=Salipaludibacillus sp. CF4.18 TaxID=3373081 RepID=UPI003EE63E04
MPIIGQGFSTTKYVAQGSGQPVIFIHGVGMDHAMWEYQQLFFAPAYRVIAYDMICHGESDQPTKDVNIVDFAQQLKDLMELLDIKDAHIIGFSMGGMVAQQFVLLYPEKVKTLTLMNVVADRNEDEHQAILRRVQQVKRDGHLTTVDKAIERWFNPNYISENPKVINNVKSRLQHNEHHSYLKAYNVFATSDQELWPQLSQITKPVLILTGENDVGSTAEMARKMDMRLPQSELVIIPKYRHMLPIEGGHIVNEVLSTFLAKYT